MNATLLELNLLPGDRIIVPKSILGIVNHHAIYLGVDYHGRDIIAENVYGRFVGTSIADDFFAKNPRPNEIVRFRGTSLERRQAIEKALSLMGKPYDLINFNCEHFANYVQRGELKSNQVGWAVVILGLITIAVLAD